MNTNRTKRTALGWIVATLATIILGIMPSLTLAQQAEGQGARQGGRRGARQGGQPGAQPAEGQNGARAANQWRTPGPDDWKREMPANYIATQERYLKEAKENAPPQEAVIFSGSATIAGWDLPKYFPDYKTIKRGFGGSMIHENTKFATEGILPNKPSVIVLYAGDNDIWMNKSPEKTFEDFKAYVKTVRDPNPNVQIVFISIRYSIARWDWMPKMEIANKLISDYIKTDPNIYYVDINPGMIGADGKPRKDFLRDDDLHLSPTGFALWTAAVTPVIKAAQGNYQKLKAAGAKK